jgi:hypothetical protein
MSLKERLSEEVDALRTVRDELRVQLHLGQSEAREKWEHLEKQWQHLEARLHRLADASRESFDDIEQAGRLLAEEIREGYRELKALL